jgi:hypothetical protein
MKFLTFCLLLGAMGLGYLYYQKQNPPKAPEPQVAAAPREPTREERIQALENRIEELRAELHKELVSFRDGVEYNGRAGRKYDAYGRIKPDSGSIGDPTRYRINHEPETTEWIGNADFKLRRSVELRREILATQAELRKLTGDRRSLY